MYNYSVSPSGIHSIWGEFKSVEIRGDRDPQVAALSQTIETGTHGASVRPA
jgi:hypothetical protein